MTVRLLAQRPTPPRRLRLVSYAGDPRRVWLVLLVFTVIACLRMPGIIVAGRFWAEEANVFFLRAWNGPVLSALLFSFGGYLNLPANLGAWAAVHLMPLRYAPYITIILSLLVQLCAPALLLSACAEWLPDFRRRLAAVALALFVPASEEVWLQTLHCQFQLVLCCGIILASASEQGRKGAFRALLLVLAPLSGLVAITLLPLFIARALFERDHMRGFEALLLAAGATVQLLFFYHAWPSRGHDMYILDLHVHT